MSNLAWTLPTDQEYICIYLKEFLIIVYFYMFIPSIFQTYTYSIHISKLPNKICPFGKKLHLNIIWSKYMCYNTVGQTCTC